MDKTNPTKKDDLKIIQNSLKTLSELEEQEKRICRARKGEVEKIQTVLKRYCDDRGLREKMARSEEVSSIIHQATDLIATLRVLIKQN